MFYSAKYDFTKTVSITQLGNDVLFADNFDWLEPLITNYNANAGKTIGDTMGEQNPGANAPNSLVVVIVGDGTFSNGSKVSDVITNDQVKGEFHWNHSSVKISGATSETKLNIVPSVCLKEDGSYNWKVKGVYRWHLDNIVVKTR